MPCRNLRGGDGNAERKSARLTLDPFDRRRSKNIPLLSSSSSSSFSASANFFFLNPDLSLLLLFLPLSLSPPPLSTKKQDALEPKISKHNMELHWGKHHRAYVTNLNGQIKGTDLENKTIEEIVKATWAGGKPTPAFNNAAQVWNHTFYWENMSPKKTAPNAALSAAIDRDFGSMDNFVKEFSAAGATQFGSGWAWLVVDKAGKLSIRKTANAETPLTDESVTAILTMDGKRGTFFLELFFYRFFSFENSISPSSTLFLSLSFQNKNFKKKNKNTVWEHAYYPVYENRRPEYIGVFCSELINWDKVGERFAAAGGK